MDVNGRIGRTVQKVAGSAAFAKVGPRVMTPLDRAVSRLSGGRFIISQALLPGLVLHATGAKTGRQRETPLACLPDGDGFYVVGSNFGRTEHPAWTANLLAHPDAEVTHRGRRIPVRARLLDADEKAAVWPRLTTIWPTYDRYVERSHRDLRVFRLDPR